MEKKIVKERKLVFWTSKAPENRNRKKERIWEEKQM